jgi:hypothetical protein
MYIDSTEDCGSIIRPGERRRFQPPHDTDALPHFETERATAGACLWSEDD